MNNKRERKKRFSIKQNENSILFKFVGFITQWNQIVHSVWSFRWKEGSLIKTIKPKNCLKIKVFHFDTREHQLIGVINRENILTTINCNERCLTTEKKVRNQIKLTENTFEPKKAKWASAPDFYSSFFLFVLREPQNSKCIYLHMK